MATVNVATSQNLTAVTYLQGDIINVLDGSTYTGGVIAAGSSYIVRWCINFY